MDMIASLLRLGRKDIKQENITDPYSLHRIVYNLYEDVRSEQEKQVSLPSGILYADLGGDKSARNILMLSNRQPMDKGYGEIQSKAVPEHFLSHSHYRFKVIVNPTYRDNKHRNLVPIKGYAPIAEWFSKRSTSSWGFDTASDHLQIDKINVLQFDKTKGQKPVTIAQATVQGFLRVTDKDQFRNSFVQGIGRARAFGCGLLQIVPLSN